MAKEKTEGATYTASDLLELAGLTYRQIHDWEKRAAVLESDRATTEGWRRFTVEEVLALCVCSALRRELALPLDRIGQLYAWLSGKRPDNVGRALAEIGQQGAERLENNPKFAALLALKGEAFKEAAREHSIVFGDYVGSKLNALATRPVVLAMKLAQLGFPAYLVTDFHSHMILQERNAVDAIATRFLKRPTIVFPLNELFNELRARKQLPPLQLDHVAPSFLDQWEKLRKRPDIRPEEQEIIRLIRERAYQRITVHVKEGEIIRAELDQEIARSEQSKTETDILAMVTSGDFQTITVQAANGKVVRVARKKTIKFDR